VNRRDHDHDWAITISPHFLPLRHLDDKMIRFNN